MTKSDNNSTGWLCTLLSKPEYGIGLLILRIFVGLMLLRHGLEKINNFEMLSSAFADPIGIGSKVSLTLITATETLGSIFIIIGLLTRPAALAVAFGMGIAAFLFHQPFSITGSELPLMYLGIAITIIITGAGRYSIDNFIGRKLCKPKK